MLDAAQTLAQFKRRGRVDRDGFQRVIGSLVRDALQAGRPLVAYGEMVALLWDAGDVPGAIELERLWNELRDEVPFSLLCGYRSASVSGADQIEALEQVCHLHSAVVGGPVPARAPAPQEVSAQFEPKPDAPAAARQMVADAVRDWGQAPELLADTQLIVSELATNAIKHARTPFSVTLRREPSGLNIAVADSSRTQPILRDADPEALFGRGMHLVADVAERWGVDPAGDGKIVWAHVRS
jgi:anti-sigma regulatory factor (Ser/Thr protein kinase)